MEIKINPSLLKAGRGWGGPEDGSYATNGGGGGGHDAAFAAGAGGGSNPASSTDQSNEWVDDVDNTPYDTHEHHQVQIQVPIPINEITDY